MEAPVVRHPEYATVERTLVERHAELTQRHGAHHLGVSKKVRNGKRRPETCITFYVLQKTDRPAGEPIPPYLDLVYRKGSKPRRIATDVCEILEPPMALGIRGGHVIIAADNEFGTIGLVLDIGGRDFLITNAHVVTDPGALPGPVTVRDPTTGKPVPGLVLKIDDLNLVQIDSDAALVELPPDSVESGMFHGSHLELEGYSDFVINDPRRFFFVAGNFIHQLRWTGWKPVSTPTTVDGVLRNYVRFHSFQVEVGQMRPGVSGSVVFCQSASGLVAVGLLFGGLLQVNEAWVFPLRHCMARMGINV